MAQVQGRRKYATRSNRIVQNVFPSILKVVPDLRMGAYLSFMDKIRKESTPQEQFFWDTDDHIATSDTVDGAVAGTTATTIKVDTPSIFNANMLIKNSRTGEIMRTKSVNQSTQVITVDRAVTALNSGGGTAAAAINDGDTLIILGSAAGENNRRQSTLTTTPTEVSNYCQIMRYDLSLSRRQLKRQFENGDELPYQQKKYMEEAMKYMNAILIDGEKGRYTDSDSGEDITLTQGIKGVPSTNTFSVGGVLYEYAFNEWLAEEGFRYGSNNKVLFASTKLILAISEILLDKSSIYLPIAKDGSNIFMKVKMYEAPSGGELMVVEDRYLSDHYNGDGILADMSQLVMKVFSGNGYNDDLHFITDTQDKDDFGETVSILGDVGLAYGNEQNHGLITGVTGGARGRSNL